MMLYIPSVFQIVPFPIRHLSFLFAKCAAMESTTWWFMFVSSSTLLIFDLKSAFDRCGNCCKFAWTELKDRCPSSERTLNTQSHLIKKIPNAQKLLHLLGTEFSFTFFYILVCFSLSTRLRTNRQKKIILFAEAICIRSIILFQHRNFASFTGWIKTKNNCEWRQYVQVLLHIDDSRRFLLYLLYCNALRLQMIVSQFAGRHCGVCFNMTLTALSVLRQFRSHTIT